MNYQMYVSQWMYYAFEYMTSFLGLFLYALPILKGKNLKHGKFWLMLAGIAAVHVLVNRMHFIPTVVRHLFILVIDTYLIMKGGECGYLTAMGCYMLGRMNHIIAWEVQMMIFHIQNPKPLTATDSPATRYVIGFQPAMWITLAALSIFLYFYMKRYHRDLSYDTIPSIAFIAVMTALIYIENNVSDMYETLVLGKVIEVTWLEDLKMILCLTCIPILILIIIDQTVRRSRTEEKNRSLENMINSSRREINLLQNRDDQVIRLQHNISAKLKEIHELLEKGDVKAASAYIQSSSELNSAGRVWSKNPTVNAVMHYISEAEKDISFHVESALDENCGIDAIDLGVLVMNILNERIEMIRKNSLKKEIELTVYQRENMVYIKVDSETADGSLGSYASMMHSVINGIIQKYNGFSMSSLHTSTDFSLCLMAS